MGCAAVVSICVFLWFDADVDVALVYLHSSIQHAAVCVALYCIARPIHPSVKFSFSATGALEANR